MRGKLRWNKIAVLLPALAGIFWGTTGPFVRVLQAEHWNNLTVLFARVVTAVIILFAGIMIKDRALLKIRLKDLWIFLVLGLVCLIGLNVCYQTSIHQMTLSFAAVLLALAPVFVLIMAAIIFKEKITVLKVLCMGLAVFGSILVSGVLESAKGTGFTVLGFLIGLASAFFYALYGIMSRVAMNHGYQAMTITFYGMLIGCIGMSPFVEFQKLGSFVQAAPAGHIGYLFLQGLCVGVLPYILYNLSQHILDTGRVSIIASGSEPAAAMVFGLLLYHEVPTVLMVAGLAVTIFGLWILCRPSSKEKS